MPRHGSPAPLTRRTATTAALHDFRVGARLGCVLAAAAVVYLALSPHGPHRPLIAAITAAAFVLAVSVELGPLARWIERRNIDAHMALWCASFVGFAALLSTLDGGLASPFVSIFSVSVAFAATALPRRGVLFISALNVAGLFAVGLAEDLTAAARLDSLGLRAAGLVAIAAVSASVSRDRSRRASALRQSQEEVVHHLARVVEFRDNDTGDHVDRMSRYSALIAEALGWPAGACHELQLAAALHDVGKVAVPDAILLKPGRLTAEERAVMERHCQAGFDMLSGSGSDLLEVAATIALTHHERYDGRGYPAGLAGEDIPLEGRIVAVADVFDALISDRVYKQAMSVPAAVEIIRRSSGTQFDPRVVDAFLRQLESIVALRATAHFSASRPTLICT